MASTVVFQLSSMVRGYHEYHHIWDAVVGETLQCCREDGNIHNPYAVSVKKGSTIVGHVLKKLSCLCSLFLQRGGNICCEVTGLQCYSSDLPQGGLEIPCNLVSEGNLKEVKKVKNLLHWSNLIHPPLLKQLILVKIPHNEV